MRSINKGGYVNMRNTKSLIEDDDGGATSFIVLGAVASVGGIIEQCILVPIAICAPVISSAIGAGSGNVLDIIRTYFANILTA